MAFEYKAAEFVFLQSWQNAVDPLVHAITPVFTGEFAYEPDVSCTIDLAYAFTRDAHAACQFRTERNELNIFSECFSEIMILGVGAVVANLFAEGTGTDTNSDAFGHVMRDLHSLGLTLAPGVVVIQV